MYTIPNSVHWEKGTLHGVGSLETLGTACLVLPLVTTDNDTHVFTYPNAIILKDNTGPNAITLSGPIMEFKGYKHASDRDNMFITTPDGKSLSGIRNLKNSFWYFEAIYDSKKAEELKDKFKRYWEPPTPAFVAANAITKKPVTTMRIPQGLPKVKFSALPEAIHKNVQRIHHLTGHAGIDRLKHLATNGLLKGIEYILAISDLKMDTCTDCVLGKMRRLPEPTKRVPRPKHSPWPCMSIDISGPHKESVQGWRYFLVARHTAAYDENGKLDLGSNYTITIGFRQRADALIVINHICKITGMPDRIHTDNAPELVSNTVQQFCAQHNIVHTTIIPYHQFQNGKAEKCIGDIKRKAKTLMMASGVPDTFWGFAVQHATALQNITGLNQAKTMTAYQAYYKEVPSVEGLFPFGALCFMFLTKEQRASQGIDTSFGPNAIAGIYLGVAHWDTHGLPWHHVFTSTANGGTHYAVHYNIHVNPELYPLKPALYTTPSELNSAFLTMTQDDLVDAELNDITYTIAAKYAKNAHKAKLQKQSKANVHDQQILKSKAGKLPAGYYHVECIVRHRGTPPNVEYEVKWEGYDDKHNEWLKAKDITPDLMKAYKETLQRKHSPSTQQTPTTIRMIPVDLINGDKTEEDTFKIMEYTKDDLLKYPEAKIIPDLPATWIERQPYPNAHYKELIPAYSYRPGIKRNIYVGKKVRMYYTDYTDPSLDVKSELGEIISFHVATQTWEVICTDNTIVDLDIHQLEFMMINSDNRTQQEETMLLIRKASYEAYLMTEPQHDTPKGLKAAMNHPEKDAIIEAMKKELQAFKALNTYDPVHYSKVPKGVEKLLSHWVFARKYKIIDGKNVFDCWKARLVFNGKHQNEHGDTYSPTPTLTTIRLMLATCCTPEWNVTHWDLSNAFCGTPLQGKEVYIIPPKGTPGIDPDEMWRIKKAINGLKDSNRLFYEYLQSHILSFSSTKGYVFKKNSAEPCMYVCTDENHRPIAYVAGYVDDLITADKTTNQHLSKELIEHLRKHWNIKEIGLLERFLGTTFTRTKDGGWEICASAYIQSAVSKFTMYPLPTAPITPIASGWNIDLTDWDNYEVDNDLLKHYQSVMGMLIWISQTVRWDIAYHVSMLTQFMTKPTVRLMQAAYRTMGYLVHTKNFFIRYKLPDQQDQQYKLYAAADSDLAGDPVTRRSQTGWFVFYNDGPIAWKSCKQDVVSLSTAEAELRSFVACTKTVIYLKRVLAQMGIGQEKIWIFEDNRACIHITENNMSPGNQRTKHVDILEKFRTELEVNNEVGAVYVPSQHNPADILTKVQTTEAFLRSKKQALAPRDILPPLVSE